MVLDLGRIKHRADIMHKSIGSNGIAIPSNARLSADGLKNVVWTPFDPGSAVTSFGSNATDITTATAAGASANAAREDHRHRGVRSITANGSNALFGNVDLQAGSGIALGVAGQVISLINIAGGASGGGGGSGAPTTAEYVTTAADATLSAERVMDLGAHKLLTRRVVANTEDDHFTAGTLDAKWLTYTGLDAVTDSTIIPSWVKITTSGYKLQAVPAGDWTIEAEIIAAGYTAAAFQNTGMIVTNGTTDSTCTSLHFGIGDNNDPLVQRAVFEKFVNGVFSSTFVSIGNSIMDHLFLKLVKSGTNYQPFYSTTGITWLAMSGSSASGITATHFGFGGTAGGYINYFVRY